MTAASAAGREADSSSSTTTASAPCGTLVAHIGRGCPLASQAAAELVGAQRSAVALRSEERDDVRRGDPEALRLRATDQRGLVLEPVHEIADERLPGVAVGDRDAPLDGELEGDGRRGMPQRGDVHGREA